MIRKEEEKSDYCVRVCFPLFFCLSLPTVWRSGAGIYVMMLAIIIIITISVIIIIIIIDTISSNNNCCHYYYNYYYNCYMFMMNVDDGSNNTSGNGLLCCAHHDNRCYYYPESKTGVIAAPVVGGAVVMGWKASPRILRHGVSVVSDKIGLTQALGDGGEKSMRAAEAHREDASDPHVKHKRFHAWTANMYEYMGNGAQRMHHALARGDDDEQQQPRGRIQQQDSRHEEEPLQFMHHRDNGTHHNHHNHHNTHHVTHGLFSFPFWGQK